MHLQRPARLLGAANKLAGLLIGRWVLGELERIGTNAAEPKRSRYAPMAGTPGGV